MAGDRGLEHRPIGMTKPGIRRQIRDLDFGATVEVALGLILLTVAWSLVLVRLSPHFEIRVSASESRPTGVDTKATMLPPEPRLQDNAVEDLRRMRAAEDRILNGYGWVDRKKGVVRIPIDRAMDLLAQRGLPGRSAHGTPNNAGNVSSQAEAGVTSGVH